MFQFFMDYYFLQIPGDQDSSLRGESPPKWSHLNVLSAAAAAAAAGSPLKQHCHDNNGNNGGGGGNGSPLSESPLHHLSAANVNYHHHHHGHHAAAAAAAAAHHHSHPHLGVQTSVHGQSPVTSHHSTISSQFSALLGASSGYLLSSSESKTMPIF
jgi:hypothetical protein